MEYVVYFESINTDRAFHELQVRITVWPTKTHLLIIWLCYVVTINDHGQRLVLTTESKTIHIYDYGNNKRANVIG